MNDPERALAPSRLVRVRPRIVSRSVTYPAPEPVPGRLASLTAMSRLEVLPFDESHLPDAGRLLAARHRRHRAVEPHLPVRYEDAGTCASEVAAVLGSDDASGAVAVRDGRIVGYLLGAPKPGAVWGRNVWVEVRRAGRRGGRGARDLYAAAAARWAEEGRTAHYVLVPAHDEALVGAWFRLAFGHQHTHAVRDVPTGPAPIPRRSGCAGRRAPTCRPWPGWTSSCPATRPWRRPSPPRRPAPTRRRWPSGRRIEDPDYVDVRRRARGPGGRIVGGLPAGEGRQPRGTRPAGVRRVPRLRRGAARGPRGSALGRAVGEVGSGTARQEGPTRTGHRWRATNRCETGAGPALGFRPTYLRCTGSSAPDVPVGYRPSTRVPGPPRAVQTSWTYFFGGLARGIRAGRPLGPPAHRRRRPWPSRQGRLACRPSRRCRGTTVSTPALPATERHHHGRGHGTRTPPTRTIAHVVERVESVGGEAFVSQGRGPHDHRPGRRHRLLPRPQPAQHARRRGRAPHLRPLQAGQPPAPPRPRRRSGSAPTDSRCRSARTRSPSSPARAPSRPPQQTLEAAEMAKAAGATLLRGGAFKPRTSPYAFQGLGRRRAWRSSPTSARRPACRSSPRSSTPATCRSSPSTPTCSRSAPATWPTSGCSRPSASAASRCCSSAA